jgi:Penicillin-Binding Protein C-terminus Family
VKRIMKVVILALVALAPFIAGAQNAGTTPNQPPAQVNNAAALRILSPHEGERLKQDFVAVHFELANSGTSAAGTPNYQIQLDGQDPVTTSSSDYTFSGVTPGAHRLTVQLVDANGTPIAGARNQVQFFILRPGAGIRRQARTVAAAFKMEDAKEPLRDLDGHELPAAGGALPLLSVIGFGALLGGIASAMKTR